MGVDRITGSNNSLNFAPSKAANETVEDTAKVFNKDWEAIQKKTFTNWINSQLKKKNANPITEINTDLSSGENLIILLGTSINLEIIGDESLGRFNKNPRLRLQKIENCNKALEFIRKRGDIVDSNPKLLLGLIWTIILRFTIADITEEGLTAKEGLLLWCQRRTTPYAADFKIKEFTFSWQDGLALCGLIHRHRPDLLNYWSLDKKDKHRNTQLAFDVAEKHLGIPKLFAVEDLVDVVKPDERSVMTYIAQYFHAFSAQDKFGVAGRRVGNLAQALHQSWEMQHDYEERVKALQANVNNILSNWSATKAASLSNARQQLKNFETYKATTKREWTAEQIALDTLLGNIQTKLKTYNLRPYHPPAGLTLDDLHKTWQKLADGEANAKRNLTKYIRETKDAIRKQYAEAANSFQDNLNAISASLSSLTGELEAQLEQASKLIQKTEPLSQQVGQLNQLDQACVEANIEDNEFTIYSVEDLVYGLSLLKDSLQKKISFIQNQIVARTKTNFTPEQLEQYSETFKFFDKDNSNSLKRDEFKAALAAEGTDFTEAEFESTFLRVSQNAEEISFEQFIEYAKSIEEDKTTPGQLKEAFQTLAGEKSFVTKDDLLRGGLEQQLVDALLKHLSNKDGGYDFDAFVHTVFSE